MHGFCPLSFGFSVAVPLFKHEFVEIWILCHAPCDFDSGEIAGGLKFITFDLDCFG